MQEFKNNEKNQKLKNSHFTVTNLQNRSSLEYNFFYVWIQIFVSLWSKMLRKFVVFVVIEMHWPRTLIYEA